MFCYFYVLIVHFHLIAKCIFINQLYFGVVGKKNPSSFCILEEISKRLVLGCLFLNSKMVYVNDTFVLNQK